MQELQGASGTSLGVTNDWVTSTKAFGSFIRLDPAEHPLSIRSFYVLLVVLLSGWLLGAALRLSSELAG